LLYPKCLSVINKSFEYYFTGSDTKSTYNEVRDMMKGLFASNNQEIEHGGGGIERNDFFETFSNVSPRKPSDIDHILAKEKSIDI
jgi:hypothetical protein